jgi:phenylalanyl-tRNA synthetase beta chain
MLYFLKKLLGIKDCCCTETSCGTQNPAKLFTDVEKEILKSTDEHIVIGKIIKITNHPDPKVTKVRITQTEIAPGIIKQILCGGVNIEEGRYVPVATVGTKFADFEIGERKIRGELSSGMICSREELGLPQDNEVDHGIWLLNDDFAEKLGEKVCDLAKL